MSEGCKRDWSPQKILLFCWRIVRRVLKIVLAAFGALVVLVGVLSIPDIPGCKRFERYCAYEDLNALLKHEDDVQMVTTVQADGARFSVVWLKPCRFLASGLAMLVYDQNGDLFDKTRDEGDDGRFQHKWSGLYTEAARADMERWLREMKIPPDPTARTHGMTMAQFAAYLERTSKDFYTERNLAIPSDNLRWKHGVRFHYAESVTLAQSICKWPPTIRPMDIGDMTVWDALSNACESVGCRFEVCPNSVWISD